MVLEGSITMTIVAAIVLLLIGIVLSQTLEYWTAQAHKTRISESENAPFQATDQIQLKC